MPSVKALGVKWDADKDVIGYACTDISLGTATKRTVLSLAAKLFDPLQLLAPYIIKAKIILQESWIEGLQWDEPFPQTLDTKIRAWVAELPTVSEFEVPRCYKKEMPIETSLHTFSDASGQAYGAVSYVRNRYSDDSITVRIVMAKARVTPLKAVSIPRLELMAAVLGLRLAIRIKELLGIACLIWWTDSMDVLHWIRGQSRKYKPFVAHRVATIQSHSSPTQWRHVPGKLNPADLASRGTQMENLIGDNIWTTGPEFLQKDEDHWPALERGETEKLSAEAQEELPKIPRKEAVACKAQGMDGSGKDLVQSGVQMPLPPMNVERFQTWIRLIRVTAWLLRVAKIARKEIIAKTSVLETEELCQSEEYWIRMTQQEHYGEIINNIRTGKTLQTGNLKPLNPFVDGKGLLRVGGRLDRSNLPFDAKHPLILPPRAHFTVLVIRRFHGAVGKHTRGVNATLSDLRQRYWIVRGREAVKTVIRDCVICIKLRKRTLEQIMASLPDHRVTIPLRAFARVGLDYGGPFIVKITRNTTAKRWLCLFTCTATRAVHLEIAYSLSTDGFLNAFSRMVARRSKPELVVSDNGSNFVGAERELRELVNSMDKEKIKDDAANLGIKWKFNPPWGSLHGGLFESMIKSTKRALRAILGEARLTDEELLTAVTEVEGLLNSRPLSYSSGDPKDSPVLTPNHFIIGNAGGQLAPRILEEQAVNPRQRWKYTQDLVTKVWKRWSTEFLSLHQNRRKWMTEKEDLKVGDVVLLVDPNNPKGKWPLGLVQELRQSSDDGHVRSVVVSSGNKNIVRPISKLVKLELNSSGGSRRNHGGENVNAKPT